MRETLRTLNPTAPVIDVQHGHVAPSVVFREPDRSELDRTTDLQELFKNSDGMQSHAPHKAIATFAIVRDTPIPAVALTLFLEALADHCGSDLLRLKGLIAIAEYPSRPAVVHGVQHVFHPPHWLSHWPSDDTRTRLIFIGRHLRPKWIEALLNAIELEVADYQGGVSAESDLRAPDESPAEQTGAN